MNLLIVDDEILTIEGIMNGVDWDRLSFDKVLTSCTIDKARRFFQEYAIDILLCDIEMPEGTGLDLLEWIRDAGYKTECVFFTCHEEFTYAKKAIELQSFDYILKPIPYEELTQKLGQVAARVEKDRQSEQYQAYGKQWIREKCFSEEKTDEKGTKAIIEEVKNYIREHIGEELSANKIAGHVFISPDYLTRILKKEESCTLVEYITKERMFFASELLKTMDFPTSVVSLKAGYSDYCYFSKVFKKIYGISPSQYKKVHRLNGGKPPV